MIPVTRYDIDHARKIERALRHKEIRQPYEMRIPANIELDSDFSLNRVFDAAEEYMRLCQEGKISP